MRHSMSVAIRQFFENLSKIKDLSNIFESCHVGSAVFVRHGPTVFRTRGLRTRHSLVGFVVHPPRTYRSHLVREFATCANFARSSFGRGCCIELT